MWICLDCYELFEDPVHWEERHGLETPPFEQINGSPCCYAAYTEAHRCGCCGKWISDDYFKIGDERYCQDCCQYYILGSE